MKLIISAFTVCLLFCFAKCTAPGAGASATVSDTVYTYKTDFAGGTGKYYMGRETAHTKGAGGAGSA